MKGKDHKFDGWLLIVLTLLTALSLLANHVIHGTGCWGAQPGGYLSDWLYFGQLCLIFVGMITVGIRLIGFRYSQWLSDVAMILCTLGLTIYLFWWIGWRIGTTIHYQSIENLAPFSSASLTTILLGIHLIRSGNDRRATNGKS